MSKGLQYLATMRPEAMQGLLTFYGRSAQALDEKTRFLISVVTKVVAGTERGLRQYAPRALAAGASKEELLDAVLMAFPAAGLTNVITAVETLMGMGLLPEVATAAADQPTPPELELGPLSQFPIGQMTAATAGERKFLVYRESETGLQVYDARCPHRQGDVTLGACEGTVVECPAHHWKFDIRDGTNLNAKLAGLRVCHASIKEGWIFVPA